MVVMAGFGSSQWSLIISNIGAFIVMFVTKKDEKLGIGDVARYRVDFNISSLRALFNIT